MPTKSLLKAVAAGRCHQVQLLLDIGVSVEEQDECGQTPLIRAVFLDQQRTRNKIIRTLLKKGALTSKTDAIGRNAIDWACLYGHNNDLALLLEYTDVDLDLNKRDIYGQTALFHAASSGNAATVKIMVEALRMYDLAVDIPDDDGVTPLMRAMKLGHDICSSIIIQSTTARFGLRNTKAERYKFAGNEQWAVKTLRGKRKVRLQSSKSQFPPITRDRWTSQSNKYSRYRWRVRNLDSGSETSSSSDEVLMPQIWNHADGPPVFDRACESFKIDTPVRNCLQNVPVCRIPESVLLSPTSSTKGNLSCGSEVESLSSSRNLKPPVDLVTLFGVKEEQMCRSYRAPARPETLPLKDVSTGSTYTRCTLISTDGREEPTTERKVLLNGSRTCDINKWTQLKKTLHLAGFKKTQTYQNKTHVTGHVEHNNIGDSLSDRSETVNMSSLPSIVSKRKIHLVQSLPTVSDKLV